MSSARNSPYFAESGFDDDWGRAQTSCGKTNATEGRIRKVIILTGAHQHVEQDIQDEGGGPVSVYYDHQPPRCVESRRVP